MRFQRFVLVLLTFFSLGILLNSCAKDDNGIYEHPGGDFAAVSAFNGKAQTSGLDLLIDNKQINFSHERLATGESMTFRTVFPGVRQLAVRTKNSSNFMLRMEQDFKQNNFYSIFFYGNKEFKYLLSQDDLSLPKPGLAKIRFVNLLEGKGIQIQQIQGNKQMAQQMGLKVGDFSEVRMESLNFQVSIGQEKTEPLSINLDPRSQGIYTICVFQNLNPETEKLEYQYEILKILVKE